MVATLTIQWRVNCPKQGSTGHTEASHSILDFNFSTANISESRHCEIA